jgi:hypothetical protein
MPDVAPAPHPATFLGTSADRRLEAAGPRNILLVIKKVFSFDDIPNTE